MSGTPGGGTPDAAPIFIVGAPRSGTSLLRTLLNRHPAIALCDETYYFYYVYERRRAFGDLAAAAARRRLIDNYLATQRVRRLEMPLDELASLLMRDGTTYASFFATVLRFYATCHRKLRCGEKTPQHVFFIPTLRQWYPRCRIIHLIRDPRDVVASLLRMPWASPNVLVNARLWRDCVLAAERWSGTGNLLAVRYEQLVAEPQSELQRVCSFIGEEYRHEMLVPGDAPAPAAWWFSRALEPVTTARCGTWRNELSRRQVALVEWITGPLMRQLGYQPEAPAAGMSVRLRATAAAAVGEAHEKLRQLPRMWYYWVRPTRLAAEERRIEGRNGAAPEPTSQRGE